MTKAPADSHFYIKPSTLYQPLNPPKNLGLRFRQNQTSAKVESSFSRKFPGECVYGNEKLEITDNNGGCQVSFVCHPYLKLDGIIIPVVEHCYRSRDTAG